MIRSKCISNVIFWWTLLIASNWWSANAFDQVHPDCRQPMHVRFLPESDGDWRLFGHCNRSIPMYSYNTSSGNCEDQMAFGCPANANSFNSYYTCMNFCRTLPPTSREPQPPPEPMVCTRPTTFATQCDNFEAHHYKYYFNGTGCSPFVGDCLFNGNHFQTQAQCELSCVRRPAAMSDGGALLPTRQPICYTRIEFRVQGDCRSRPLLRNSRWQMQVSGQETPVTPDAGAAAPFFVFDAKLNKCRAQHLHECVWNGNRFETLDHCLWNCIPRSFDCPYCDAHRYRKWQSVCNHSKQSRHLYECFVQARSFNWTALHEEVLRLEQLFGNTGLTIVLARSLLWLTALVAILPLRAHF